MTTAPSPSRAKRSNLVFSFPHDADLAAARDGAFARSRGAISVRGIASETLRLRGRREDRVSADTHGPRAAKKHAAEPQVQPITGLPRAVVGTAYSALSPVRRAFWPPYVRQCVNALRTDTSVEVSGPRSLAVRTTIVRLHSERMLRHRAATAPRLHARDDRETPLFGEAGWADTTMISEKKKVEYFLRRAFTCVIALNARANSTVWRKLPCRNEGSGRGIQDARSAPNATHHAAEWLRRVRTPSASAASE